MDDFGTLLLALSTAAILGGAVGAERELRRRWAGLRTHMMVSVGCTTFVLAGLSVSAASEIAVTRVIQGIAAGIGFIGAGTVLKLTKRLEIRGLTTAGSLWLAAALGCACGVQQYLLAVLATVLTLVILTAVGQLEKLLPLPRKSPTSGTAADHADLVAISSRHSSSNGPHSS